ncbi:hypothetical protein C8N30_2939 [Sulfitobacter guttiformis]|uniref:Uncharacterized protein n=1 Tax=Sulfitobacter guttiformis TaxID=74349 RepID=A0A420DHY2_9RHOB|nr:hypothetical protein C8N30_2939 [Sulfitobacter guttiformis]
MIQCVDQIVEMQRLYLPRSVWRGYPCHTVVSIVCAFPGKVDTPAAKTVVIRIVGPVQACVGRVEDPVVRLVGVQFPDIVVKG